MKRSTTSPAGDDLQFKLLLPRALHQRIADSAEERGNSVSQEIRRRLEASFVVEADRDTLALVEAIKLAAPAAWRSSPRAFAIMRSAIDVLLRQFQPRGEVPPEEAAAVAQEGALMAGVALGALELPVHVGEVPSRLDRTRNEGSEA